MGISESIYEGVLETYYLKILGQMPTVLVTARKLEEKPPFQILTPILGRELSSAGKYM